VLGLPLEAPSGADRQKAQEKVRAERQQNFDKSKQQREAKTEQNKKDRQQRQKQKEREKDGEIFCQQGYFTCLNESPAMELLISSTMRKSSSPHTVMYEIHCCVRTTDAAMHGIGTFRHVEGQHDT